MNFKTADQINQHLIQLTRTERNHSHEILVHIQLFDKISGFLKLGYPTLYSYLKGELKYSEDQAYRRVKAAKLLNTNPEVAEKIRNGTLNLTQAMQLQNAIAQAGKLITAKVGQTLNKLNGEVLDSKSKEIKSVGEDLKQKVQSIVDKIENKNSFDTQKIIAEELNLPASTRDKVKPLSNQTIRMELHFTIEQYEKLKQIKNIYSHKYPEQKTSDIIEFLCDQVLAKGEKRKVKTENIVKATSQTRAPRKSSWKASRNASLNALQNILIAPECPALSAALPTPPASQPAQLPTDPTLELDKPRKTGDHVISAAKVNAKPKVKDKTRHVPNEIRRFVLKRAANKCEFTSKNGRKCNSEYQLEIEHIIPFSQGGSHCAENLAMFCSHHNAHSATQLAMGFENFL